jgi:hypothetical protein
MFSVSPPTPAFYYSIKVVSWSVVIGLGTCFEMSLFPCPLPKNSTHRYPGCYRKGKVSLRHGF